MLFSLCEKTLIRHYHNTSRSWRSSPHGNNISRSVLETLRDYHTWPGQERESTRPERQLWWITCKSKFTIPVVSRLLGHHRWFCNWPPTFLCFQHCSLVSLFVCLSFVSAKPSDREMCPYFLVCAVAGGLHRGLGLAWFCFQLSH